MQNPKQEMEENFQSFYTPKLFKPVNSVISRINDLKRFVFIPACRKIHSAVLPASRSRIRPYPEKSCDGAQGLINTFI
jgi:hypothetical protein